MMLRSILILLLTFNVANFVPILVLSDLGYLVNFKDKILSLTYSFYHIKSTFLNFKFF